ncbi:copper transporter [Pseudactinotalea terrae]|uniref:copper transporter n=1 Tax=Pseudactinotalea terrae TaxID=1743262 RepID=UPI0012E29D7E|nr:copper transporter [Pseudactinotalea terrae]
MIDFRYHIVSLIAVFLALAVGVVLGAGPLQGEIGNQLTVQIEQLRQEKEDLRVQLETSDARAGELALFLDGASPQLLAGTLTDVDVAIVTTAEAAPAVTEALIERVEQAGGSVVSQVALTPRWTNADDAPVRDETAETLASQMVVPPPAETSNAQVLGMGLSLALTQRDPLTSDPAFSTGAQEAYTTLRDADLVAEVAAPARPADAVLIVAPAPIPDAEPDASVLGIHVDTVTGFTGTDAVVAGTATMAADLLDAIRSDPEASAAVSTVDSSDLISGQVTAPLALAALDRGAAVDHYGTAGDANAVLPTLPDRPEDEPTGETGGEPESDATDGGTDDATDGSGSTADETTEEAS